MAFCPCRENLHCFSEAKEITAIFACVKKAVFSDMDEKERQFIKRINDKEEEGYRELFRRYYRYLVVVAHLTLRMWTMRRTSRRMRFSTCGRVPGLSIRSMACSIISIRR